MIVAGQPAAGKSRTVHAAVKSLGSAVVIDSDEFRQLHPQLAEIMRRDPQRMDVLSNGPVGYWVDNALEYCRANRLNTILESTLTRPEQIHDTVNRFRSHGFTAVAEVLAVPPAISRLGIVSRYLAGHHPSTRRWTTNNAHHRAIEGLADGIRQLHGVFAEITVRDRSAAELYRGTDTDAAAAIITAQHTRALTAQENADWASDFREACPRMLEPGFITAHTATVSRLITDDAARLLLASIRAS